MGHAHIVASLRSALVRPLDWRYPTNLAVMILAPAAGLLLGIVSFRQLPDAAAAARAAGHGMLAVFAAWALAREIAPDDNPAAFASLGLAFVTLFFFPRAGLLPVFTAIMLARILNRSAGVAANLLDSTAVTLLALWAAWDAGQPGPAFLAAGAFGLDMRLAAPRQRQWIFAALSLVGGLVVSRLNAPASLRIETPWLTFPVIVIALIYGAAILLVRTVRSVGDLSGQPLNLNRVRAGMAITWLMGIQGALAGNVASPRTLVIWATLAGVIIMTMLRPRAAGLLTLGLVAALGCTPSAAQHPGPVPRPADTVISVGDHRLHFRVWPARSRLTLVFEAGGAADLAAWESVPSMAARELGLRTVAYDRAGLGSSGTGPMTLVPLDESRHLMQALDRLGARQIVLVGHSYGGLLSMLHALRNPGRVAGMVLVDPMNTDFIQRVSLAWLNTTAPDIAHPASARDTVIVRMKRTIGDLVAATERGIATLEMPMVVLTAGVPWWGDPAKDEAWRASHESIAGSRPNRRLLVAEQSRHGIPGTEPGRIIDAIRLLLPLIQEGN